MNAKDVIKNTLSMGDMILTTYLGDFTDEELLMRAVPGMNHAAWQLGHLISSERRMMTDAGFDMPALPDGFDESYSAEAAKSNDAAKFLKKDAYLELLQQQRAATMERLDALPEADLDKPAPEAMRAYAATIGALFNMLGVHVLMHAPQFVALRRKLDKPVTI